jgi:hypothetical protein
LASSPYARKGVLWDLHRRHYGADGDPLILVARGASRIFNPTLQQRVVDRALARDHAAAAAEYLAQFRSDIETFVAYEIVEACVGDYTEIHSRSTLSYSPFVDPSGGSAGSFTLAITHADDERAVIDAVREITPPFSPDAVVEEYAAQAVDEHGTLRDGYGVRTPLMLRDATQRAVHDHVRIHDGHGNRDIVGHRPVFS